MGDKKSIRSGQKYKQQTRQEEQNFKDSLSFLVSFVYKENAPRLGLRSSRFFFFFFYRTNTRKRKKRLVYSLIEQQIRLRFEHIVFGNLLHSAVGHVVPFAGRRHDILGLLNR